MFAHKAVPAPEAAPRFAEYESALERLNSLRHEEAELDRKISEHNSARGDASRRHLVDIQARALLAAQESKVTTAEMIDADIQACYTRRQVVRRAITLQERSVEQLRCERSRVLATEKLDEHATAVGEICRCLVALAHANDREFALRTSLQEQGCDSSSFIRPMQFGGVTFRDDYSNGCLYLKEALENGKVTIKELRSCGAPESFLEYLEVVCR